MTENQKEQKNPNYFWVGMRKASGYFLMWMFLPLILIIMFFSWFGGNPKLIKTFIGMENPIGAIFILSFLWILSFTVIYVFVT